LLLLLFYCFPTGSRCFSAVATGDIGSFLEFKRGDLIELGEDSADMIQSSGWCYGLCVGSGKRGDFPAECVYILPTINRPSDDILVLDSPGDDIVVCVVSEIKSVCYIT